MESEPEYGCGIDLIAKSKEAEEQYYFYSNEFKRTSTPHDILWVMCKWYYILPKAPK